MALSVKSNNKDVTQRLMNMEDVTVVIPAASYANESIVPFSMGLSSAMVPLNGRPVIYWSISYLAKLGVKNFVVAVPSNDSHLSKFIKRVFAKNLNIITVVPDKMSGVGYTIASCLEEVKTQRLLIVLGDTYFQFDEGTNLEPFDFVLYSKVNESYRWCLVEFDKNKKIGKFIEKPLTYDKEAFALIGVYGVSDVALFRKCVNGLLGESMKKTPSLQLQVSHLLERYMQHLPIKALPLKEWFDCGNVDNLITSREKLLESRAFNEISVDDLSGIITKYSKEKDKFVDEIQYYQLLPADIQIFFPRIIDYKISGDKPCLKMEYYGYPSLSELFIYGNLHFAVWAQVFNHLKRILEIFNKYQVPAKKESFHYMYVEKTHERLDKLRGQPEFKDGFLKYNNIKLNSRPIKNIDLIWPEITKLIFALKEDNFTIIHGDLCFSNILYNVESRICKLIDPRGSFGEKGIFGDTKYDIAKLYHSVCGNYDFITNDLFEIKINGAAVELDIFCDTYHENVRKLFKEIILREYDEAKIKLINGLLFISMCPLHYEEPKRQLAMFVIGLNYLNEVLNSSSL